MIGPPSSVPRWGFDSCELLADQPLESLYCANGYVNTETKGSLDTLETLVTQSSQELRLRSERKTLRLNAVHVDCYESAKTNPSLS